MIKNTIIVLLLIISFGLCQEGQNIKVNDRKEIFFDGPPITRSEVILTAHEFTRIHWQMMEKNQIGTNCEGNFKSEYPVGARIGMGYMWGGWDDIDTFLKKISVGHGTGTGGNISYKEFSKDCVSGTSCTGLVSRAWHLNCKYTLNYPQYPEAKEQFHRITFDINDVDFSNHKTETLKKGDAFINGGHIILFIYETRDGTAMVMDSRANGVSFREMSWMELEEGGYKPIRYNNIKNVNNPQGTLSNPIIINFNDLPVSLENNTRDFVSMEFDRYSIAPAFNEQGPEVIYKIQIETKSKVLLFLTEVINEGIDNDIYLLKSLNSNNNYLATDCIARGDSWVVQELDIGNYYIVIDSGKDQPGEYKLNIRYLDK